MRINQINLNNNHRKVLKNQNKQNVSVTSYSPSFTGNYLNAYKSALNTNFEKSYTKVEQTFWKLFNAAKSEKDFINPRYANIFNSSMKECLANTERLSSYDKEVVMTSRNSKYESPLITVEDGALSFHDPINGEFGRGNISFWLNNGVTHVARPVDHHSFYNNRNIKEYYQNSDSGIIY